VDSPGRRTRGSQRQAVRPVLRESHYRREPGRVDCLTKTSGLLGGDSDAHACAEHLRCEIPDAVQHRRASSEYHAGAEPASVPGALDLALCQGQDLVEPLMDDVRQQLTGNVTLALRRSARQEYRLARGNERLVRGTVALLEPLRVRLSHSEPLHYVAG